MDPIDLAVKAVGQSLWSGSERVTGRQIFHLGLQTTIQNNRIRKICCLLYILPYSIYAEMPLMIIKQLYSEH